MKLRKCPRCELNYILDDGDLCTVCREEVHGRSAPIGDEDDMALCSVCGEALALPGQDLCEACLAELDDLEKGGEDTADDEGDGHIPEKRIAAIASRADGEEEEDAPLLFVPTAQGDDELSAEEAELLAKDMEEEIEEEDEEEEAYAGEYAKAN